MKSRSGSLGRLIVLFALVVFASSVQSAADPKQLQDQAIKRIDLFVEHFRKSGDFKTRVADLLLPAQNDLRASYQAFSAQGDLAGAALSQIKLGSIQRMLGQWQPALEVYQAAVKTARAAKHAGHQAEALTGLAQAEDSSRNSASALAHIDEAVELAGPLSDKKYSFDALSVKGSILIRQGNLAAAADILNRALALAPELKEEKLFYAYLDRGDVYNQLANKCDHQKHVAVCHKQYELARADFERARAVAQKLGWTGLQKETETFLTHLTIMQSMLQSRGRVNEQVKQSGLFHPKRAGDVLVSERFADVNPDVAETLAPLYEEAQHHERLAGGFADIVAARSAHTDGLMRQARGDLDGAMLAFLKAVDLVEKDRGKLRDEGTRGKFLEDKISFYHAPALVYLEKKHYAEAFSLLERSKSRAMADLLASRELALATPAERSLYAATVELKTKIANQQGELFKLIASAGKKGEMAEKDAAIQKLEEQYRTLLERLAKQAPKAQELIVASSATLDQLQQAMRGARFEVLQYLVQDTGIVVWHVSADSVHVRNVFLPRRELIDKIAAMQYSLSDRNAKFDDTMAKELFLFLVQPALAWIKAERLVIIPHDELHGLSFQALLNPADGRFLGEHSQLSYAPSATVLLRLKPAGAIGEGNLLAISPVATKSMAARLAAKGVDMIDAPVSGGEVGAVNATLTIMCGGKQAVFDKVKPILECMGKTITLVGDSGAGQVAKACNQIVVGVSIEAVSEALTLARSMGVDPGKVREALMGGFAGSKIMEIHGKRIIDNDFKPGFKTKLHQKDMRIVMDAAHSVGLNLPGAALFAQHLNALMGSGDGELDSSAVAKVLERASSKNRS